MNLHRVTFMSVFLAGVYAYPPIALAFRCYLATLTRVKMQRWDGERLPDGELPSGSQYLLMANAHRNVGSSDRIHGETRSRKLCYGTQR
jgi:hypothetical protein